VKRIVREDGSWLVEWDSAQGEESARASEIILATDSKNSEQILSSSFGSEIDGMFFPRALSNAVVRLWFDVKLDVPEAGIFTGDFTVHNFFWLDQLSNPYRRWARETGGSALEMHIYGPPETLAQPDAVLLARAITDAQQAWTELRGHVIKRHLQRNDETHTLPEVGDQLGIVTPWKNLFCAGDWVRHPMPSFFLERACATGIEAANAVLEKRGLQKFALVNYLPAEPFVAWIEKLMIRGRKARRKRRMNAIHE
jgi:isorenieratene synthase